jgi:subtilisin family serine protease
MVMQIKIGIAGFLFAAVLAVPSPSTARPGEVPARPFAESAPIPGRYIVVFNNRVKDPAATANTLMRGSGGRIHHTYRFALQGFSATIPDAAYQSIRMNPNVAYIEQDATVRLISTTQTNATWGIDRLDQRDLPLDSRYTYADSGAGVHAYIIDTGIRSGHREFSGRLAPGATTINDGRGTEDCNGHGTHVASTTGGTTYGVAKAVTLVAVRVLDCQGAGSWSGVIAGIDWVTEQKVRNPSRPMVANMSLGGGANRSVDSALQKSVNAGVVYVVAAGNSSDDACNYSPAREPAALTVGATDNNDSRSSFSNFGACVDLFAPGRSITAAWNSSNTAINTLSGTSMAAPHVAGVVARALQVTPTATAAAIHDRVVSAATPGKVGSAGTGSPNRLLYADPAGAQDLTNVPPTAVFTASCSDLLCAFNASTSSDSDGSILGYDWAFGDGGAATGVTATRAYSTAGTYTVTLTVTDDRGATDTASQAVTASAANPVPILDAPTGLAASDITRSSFRVTWQASAGATGYVIDVSTRSDFRSLLVNNVDVGSNRYFDINGLKRNTSYFVRMRAYADALDSDHSATLTVRTSR